MNSESKDVSESPFQISGNNKHGQPMTRYEIPEIENYVAEKIEKRRKRPSELIAEFSQQNTTPSKEKPKNTFVPQQISKNHDKMKEIYSPKQQKLQYTIFCFISSFLFFVLFFINVYPEFFFFASIFAFILGVIASFAAYWRSRPKLINQPKYYTQTAANTTMAVAQEREFPHEIFSQKESKESDQMKDESEIIMNAYNSYNISDRPSSSLKQSKFTLTNDLNIYQLATDSLKRVGLTSAVFNKYVVNMKAFIQKTMLKKLSEELAQVQDPVVEAMISVPNGEYCKQYILSRIDTLAHSLYLSGHYGDKGMRWNDKEWSNEYPSDNQIVMHILSVWLSSLIEGRKETKKLKMHFKERYLYIGSDPFTNNEDDIIICSEDWSNFYVLAKYKSLELERFYVFPGRDSMYAGLTLFFYLIKMKNKFLLEGCDLTYAPFFMDRVFSNERFE